MANRRYFSPKFLIFIPVLLVLMIAVACGEDATPTPTKAPAATATPTSVPPTPTPTPEAMVEKETPTPRPLSPTPTKAPVATPTPTPPPAAPGMVTSKTKTLVIAAGPPNWETLLPWASGHIDYKRPLFEFLGGLDRITGEKIPELATEFSLSSDAVTWTIKLQQGVQFHFGWGEITSKDWAHALEMSDVEGSVDGGRIVFRGMEEVNTPDPYTLVLVQGQPDTLNVPFFYYGHAGGTVGTSKDYWDAEGIEAYKVKPVGTGPYRFVSNVTGASVNYERVEDHWRHTPEFQEMKQLWTSEPATRMAMILAGEAHIVTVSRDLEPVLAAGGMEINRSSLSAIIYGFAFGGSHFEFDKIEAAGYDMSFKRNQFFPRVLDQAYYDLSPWTHPVTGILVREAMNRAIDRQTIQDTLFAGEGDLMHIYGFHRTLPGWNPQWEADFDNLYGFDPAKARDLLAQAGYPNGFKLQMLGFPNRTVPENEAVMAVIADYMKDIGLDVEFVVQNFSVRLELQRERRLQGHIGPFIGGYRDVQFTAKSYYAEPAAGSTWENLFTWQSYDKIVTATDLAERDNLIRALGDEIYYDYGGMPLINMNGSAVVNPAVVKEYVFPGTARQIYTHLEFVKAADPQ